MVDRATAFRYAVYYRAIASAAFVVGGGLTLLGIWLGIGPAIAVYLTSFLQPDAASQAMGAANAPLAAVLVVVGTTIWQVGKAWALYWTFTAALEEGVGEATGATGGRPASAGSSTPSATTASSPAGEDAD